AAIVVESATQTNKQSPSHFLGSAEANSKELIDQGRQIFRFDTFGDEAFWTGQLQIQQAVSKLSPRQALSLGLKVDSDALPSAIVAAIRNGEVNLDDPAVTAQLLKSKAVLGVVGTFDGNTLKSIGLTCAICHSTVNDSIAPGIGSRIDGLANRDLNGGASIAAAPTLQPFVDLLKLAPQDAGITVADVRKVLNGWGPG